MDLGMFMMPLHGPDRDYTSALREDREMIILGDELGFSEAWVGEHTSCRMEPIVSPLQFFASLIHCTKKIKFCTGVIPLGQHHPALLAGEVAQFDHLSEGRFVLGVGPGGLVSDIELYGTTEKNRQEMVQESLELMRKIWDTDPPYSLRGKYWDIVIEKTVNPKMGFGTMLRPYQKPYPPVAISVMSSGSTSASQAGENGWGMVSANFAAARVVKTHWESYSRGCEKAGHRPDRTQWRVARDILVTDTDAEAADYLADANNSYAKYYDYVLANLRMFQQLSIARPSDNIPDDEVTTKNCLDRIVLFGSPKMVLDKLVAFADDLGYSFGTLLYGQKDWDKPDLHRRSMRLLATEVLPKLRGHIASQRLT